MLQGDHSSLQIAATKRSRELLKHLLLDREDGVQKFIQIVIEHLIEIGLDVSYEDGKEINYLEFLKVTGTQEQLSRIVLPIRCKRMNIVSKDLTNVSLISMPMELTSLSIDAPKLQELSLDRIPEGLSELEIEGSRLLEDILIDPVVLRSATKLEYINISRECPLALDDKRLREIELQLKLINPNIEIWLY